MSNTVLCLSVFHAINTSLGKPTRCISNLSRSLKFSLRLLNHPFLRPRVRLFVDIDTHIMPHQSNFQFTVLENLHQNDHSGLSTTPAQGNGKVGWPKFACPLDRSRIGMRNKTAVFLE